MVKGVTTSIITVAVLMGSLVACSGNEGSINQGSSTNAGSINQESSADADYVEQCVDLSENNIEVKYRETTVDITPFEELKNCDGKISAGWYDYDNSYLILRVGDTNYHYCRVMHFNMRHLQNAESPYAHYLGNIRGNFDCRANNGANVPSYDANDSSQEATSQSDDPCEAVTTAESEEDFRDLAERCLDDADYEPAGRAFFELRCLGIQGEDNNCGGLSEWIIATGDTLEERGYDFDKRCFANAIIEMLQINQSLNGRDAEVELAIRLCLDGEPPELNLQSSNSDESVEILTDDYSWGSATAQKTKALQQVLGVTADGVYGQGTRAAHISALEDRDLSTDNVPEPPAPSQSSGGGSQSSGGNSCSFVSGVISGPHISEFVVSNTSPSPGSTVTFSFRVQDQIGFFIPSDGCNLVRPSGSTVFGWMSFDVGLTDDYYQKTFVESISRQSGNRFNGKYQMSYTVPADTPSGTQIAVGLMVTNAPAYTCYFESGGGSDSNCVSGSAPHLTIP